MQDNHITLDLHKCDQDHSAGKNSWKLLSCLHICSADLHNTSAHSTPTHLAQSMELQIGDLKLLFRSQILEILCIVQSLI